ncbi:hypothetical protein ATK17_3741 [Branchiibius hedensis]|uniref:PKD domain-containing protein n=1 Tax=Branchiibius hedensis TaxID=672460 RepID=A0A2Y9BML4_9MICO|nr:hypothetical protein ATK17_3741 [Branchiibius hedensis]SSA58938.1 hypothetical protein SAMN04489750_3741 [Branchiibius hedensis]
MEGHTDGAIYDCLGWRFGRSLATMTLKYWAATAPAVAPPPDPRVLAQQAIRAMNLQAVAMGWLLNLLPVLSDWWDAELDVGQAAAPNTWGPITKSASAQGYTVTATATVSDVVWDMGDGQTVTCQQGTPYVMSYGKQKSPTCGHTYTRQGLTPSPRRRTGSSTGPELARPERSRWTSIAGPRSRSARRKCSPSEQHPTTYRLNQGRQHGNRTNRRAAKRSPSRSRKEASRGEQGIETSDSVTPPPKMRRRPLLSRPPLRRSAWARCSPCWPSRR